MTASPAPARGGMVVRSMLKLYPRRWRDRYGGELTDLFASVPFSLSLLIDLIAGAIDARLHPELVAHAVPRSVAPEGDTSMVGKVMHLRCAGYGPQVTRQDQWWAAAVTIGGTIVLSLAWVWLHVRTGDNPFVDSFATVTFLAPLILSMPLTYLKGRRRTTQAVFVLGSLAIVIAGALAVGFLTSMM